MEKTLEDGSKLIEIDGIAQDGTILTYAIHFTFAISSIFFIVHSLSQKPLYVLCSYYVISMLLLSHSWHLLIPSFPNLYHTHSHSHHQHCDCLQDGFYRVLYYFCCKDTAISNHSVGFRHFLPVSARIKQFLSVSAVKIQQATLYRKKRKMTNKALVAQ